MNSKEKQNETDARYFYQILQYKDFMNMINFTNNIIVKKPEILFILERLYKKQDGGGLLWIINHMNART